MKIGFIGGGNMTESIVSGIIKKKFLKNNIEIIEIDKNREKYLKKKFDININSNDFFLNKDVIILSIKPQDFKDVLETIKSKIRKPCIIVSLLTGISTKYINKKLPNNKIIRVIPSILGFVNRSINILSLNNNLNEKEKKCIESLFKLTGDVIWEEEKFFEQLTVINGSLPAFICKFIESSIDGGLFIGLPKNITNKIVLNNMVGITNLINNENKDTRYILDKITSLSGTTISGLISLKKNKFSYSICEAIIKSYEKAKLINNN